VAAFLARRLLLGAVVLVAFSFLSFVFFAAKFYPLKGKAVLPEYWRWLSGIPSGRSLTHGLAGPIWPKLLPALGHTFALLAVTFAIVVVASVTLACLAASVRGSALDGLVRVGLYLTWGIPVFLLALIVQQVVGAIGGARGIGPFPLGGWPGSCPTGIGLNAGTLSPCPPAGTGVGYALDVLRHVTLPALALSVGFVGLHGRYLRAALVGALAAPYVTTARAKGVSERSVLLRHALRNSLITFVAVLLADFGALLGATLVVDWVFQLNGLGMLYLRELNPNIPSIDPYAVEALLLVTAGLLIVFSVLSELSVVLLDPRVRAR
jgi:ABC-type dipeptide/oligopeptide/nickel transport system permease component